MNKVYYLIIIVVLSLFSCQEKSENKEIKVDKHSTQSETEKDDSKNKLKRFSKIPSSHTGVTVKNNIIESDQMNVYKYEYLYNGGGVAAGDINNDGLPDLFFTINMGMNRLYLNKGDWKFEDISMTSNIQLGLDWSTGVTMADVNNDGWLDIYVCRSGKLNENSRKNNLFINNKDNTFTESAEQYGLADPSFSTQASFFDYDNDGDLDLYLANHPSEFKLDNKTHLSRKKKPHDHERDKLYRNDNGKFTDVSKKAGILNYSHSLGLITTDLNDDGWQDIYVSNDYFERDYYYINNKNGTFSEKAKINLKHMGKSSMGADAGDINNDGAIDIIAVEMMAEDNKRQKTNMAPMNPKIFDDLVDLGFGNQYMHNVLQLNDGAGSFSDIAYLAGVATTDWSWGPLFCDFDNDGSQDLFISNGYKRDLLDKDFKKDMKKVMGNKRMSYDELKTYIPTSIIPNYAYKNNKDLTFKKVSVSWGLDQLLNSNGGCYVDIDKDGDMDLVVNNLDAEMSLFKNNTSEINSNNYIKIKFEGPQKNKFGLGTKVSVRTGDESQYRQLSLTHGFQSSCEPILNFGLSSASQIDELIVTWLDKKVQVLKNVKPNQELTLKYKDALSSVPIKNKLKQFEIKDIAKQSNIRYTHKEQLYDDYSDQILLPHKLSQNGPGLAVGDVDGNGYDDFYVGGASGQNGKLFKQQANGKFIASKIGDSDIRYEDMGALFFDADKDGDLDLYVVSGSYEKPLEKTPYQDRLYINNGKGGFKKSIGKLPNINTSGSCVIGGDYDNDGDIDLFVGGRVLPGKYPYAPKSFLLRNDNGVFKDMTEEDSKELKEIGMVTSGLWTDYDNDDDLDLILVGEWMPITIFNNTKGVLNKANLPELEKTRGWWNSIIGSDIDNDGDIDYTLGNLGLNSKNKASSSRPFEIYCDDFDKNGSYDIALGYYNGSSVCYPVRGRQCSSESVPSIGKKIPTYQLFGESSIQDVYGEEALSKALHLQVDMFESISLLNEKGHFSIRKLPMAAQVAPTYGMISEDLNADGCLDLFIVGNQLPVEVETGAYDAHKGLVLYGDCKGSFVEETIKDSFLDGDMKSLALIRLKKGNLGMLSSENNSTLKLIPLSRVTSKNNPPSKEDTRKTEYYYGSGYLSQNSIYK